MQKIKIMDNINQLQLVKFVLTWWPSFQLVWAASSVVCFQFSPKSFSHRGHCSALSHAQKAGFLGVAFGSRFQLTPIKLALAIIGDWPSTTRSPTLWAKLPVIPDQCKFICINPFKHQSSLPFTILHYPSSKHPGSMDVWRWYFTWTSCTSHISVWEVSNNVTSSKFW